MKNLKCLLIIALIALNLHTTAQTTRKEKKAAKEAAIKQNVDNRNYTFIANTVLPLRGHTRYLTSEYDLRITKDSVIAYLPYFGQAYFDVAYNDPDKAGIKFTSTHFSYVVNEKKKNGWEIVIKPTDVRNTNSLVLNISTDGYASLSVNSTNRDFITFDGYLK